MATFKEGDWVRYKFEVCEIAAGTIAKVDDVFSPESLLVRTPSDGRGYYASPRELEPWTPKVGERVRVVGNDQWIGYGEVYKVDQYNAYLTMKSGRHAGDRGGFKFVVLEPLPVAAEAQPAAPAPLTIRAGKFYKTRDGRKVGPMVDDCSFDCVAFIEKPGDGRGWSKFGIGLGLAVGEDLIAEWVEPTTNVAATVDALDEEYGPVATVAGVQKYRKGDRVVCLGDANGQFTKGKTYTVSKDFCGGWGESVKIAIDDSGSKSNGWMPKFFAPAMTQQSTPAIVALIENGQPLPNAKPRVHTNVEAADAEARRLAGVHKGQEFGVFALTGTPHKVEKVYEHEWQRLAAAGERIRAVKALSAATGLDLHSARDAIDGWKRRAA